MLLLVSVLYLSIMVFSRDSVGVFQARAFGTKAQKEASSSGPVHHDPLFELEYKKIEKMTARKQFFSVDFVEWDLIRILHGMAVRAILFSQHREVVEKIMEMKTGRQTGPVFGRVDVVVLASHAIIGGSVQGKQPGLDDVLRIIPAVVSSPAESSLTVYSPD